MFWFKTVQNKTPQSRVEQRSPEVNQVIIFIFLSNLIYNIVYEVRCIMWQHKYPHKPLHQHLLQFVVQFCLTHCIYWHAFLTKTFFGRVANCVNDLLYWTKLIRIKKSVVGWCGVSINYPIYTHWTQYSVQVVSGRTHLNPCFSGQVFSVLKSLLLNN